MENFSNDMNNELNRQKELREQRESTRLVPTPSPETAFDKLDRTFTSLGFETFARSGDNGCVVLEVRQGDRTQQFYFNLDGSVRAS